MSSRGSQNPYTAELQGMYTELESLVGEEGLLSAVTLSEVTLLSVFTTSAYCYLLLPIMLPTLLPTFFMYISGSSLP